MIPLLENANCTQKYFFKFLWSNLLSHIHTISTWMYKCTSGCVTCHDIHIRIYMSRYPYKGTSGRVTCQRTGDLLSPGHAPQGPTCQSNIYWTLKRAGNKILRKILGMNFIFVTWPPKHLGLTFLQTLSFQNSFALATLKLILHRKCWCGDRWQLSNKLTSVYSREGQWLSTIRGTSGNYNPTPHTISCCPIASLNDTEHWSL